MNLIQIPQWLVTWINELQLKTKTYLKTAQRKFIRILSKLYLLISWTSSFHFIIKTSMLFFTTKFHFIFIDYTIELLHYAGQLKFVKSWWSVKKLQGNGDLFSWFFFLYHSFSENRGEDSKTKSSFPKEKSVTVTYPTSIQSNYQKDLLAKSWNVIKNFYGFISLENYFTSHFNLWTYHKNVFLSYQTVLLQSTSLIQRRTT